MTSHNDDAELSARATALLSLLPPDGAAVGNGRLRQVSGFDEPSYQRAVAELIAAGRAKRGRGRGGSLAVVPNHGPAASTDQNETDDEHSPRIDRSNRHAPSTDAYVHTNEVVLRPEAGTQAQFKRNKLPTSYAYDSSLSPALDWAGKAEETSFDVPTLPLFVHERLSTKAIIETLTDHKRDPQLEFQLFADPQLSLAQQLEAYEHTGGWVNRLILSDSLVAMNSLLEYESLGGQVQTVYMDPPYGVNYRSNFQPFVRRRAVKEGDDGSVSREPEMVKAYRDTWSIGVHSYLTYLRDRFLVARHLLASTGSIFVQIGEQNVHLVRSVLDEVFGADNFITTIWFKKKKMPLGETFLFTPGDYILWFAKDRAHAKFHRLYLPKDVEDPSFSYVELEDGSRLSLAEYNRQGLTDRYRLFQSMDLRSSGRTESCVFPVEFEGQIFVPGRERSWKTNQEGMERLRAQRRLFARGGALRYVLYLDDYPVSELSNIWGDTQGATDPVYVVQTSNKVVERCLLMTTDPGDLVLDPTCGSGTTAYVAEQLGRRWIAMDTSRVPLALARQRLLTATFPYYELRDSERGPVSGFVFRRRQNRKSEEVGGIVPHVTLESVANDKAATEEIMVDRPEIVSNITRVSGPFCVEATIPTPINETEELSEEAGSFAELVVSVLRRSPVLQLDGGEKLVLDHVRRPAKALTIAAEATLGSDGPGVAVVVGPENGAVSERLVYEGAREAHARSFARLLVIGFAVEAAARELVDKCHDLIGIPATYVQATPDLVMGDLLKTMRSSQIFSVTGLPDVALTRLDPEEPGGPCRWQVDLRGLDVFDPVSMQVSHRSGDDAPAWFLDTDYNGMCFHVSQAFFPRTSAWDSLKVALRGEFDDTVWDHLAGTTSAPFVAGESGKVAVKVIDDRGNELLVVKDLEEQR